MSENKLTKKYGLATAICMVVGIVVGSGVFFKAQTILQKTGGDMMLGILAWIIGGVIMLVCISAFSFMATKYEKVNGFVDYAEALVGKKYGYYVGWFALMIYYPGMTSALVWLSARYTLVFITSAFPSVQLVIPASEGGCLIGPECFALSLFILVASYSLNALSPKIAGKFQVSTTVIKLIPLILMAVVGTIVGLCSPSATLVNNFNAPVQTTGHPLFAAVVATSFAYEGWILATVINAELKDAKRNLPLALLIGGIIIICIYLFYYIGVAGGADVNTLMKDGASVAFTNIFGNTFGSILNLFVAISCMGTVNGLMLAMTRGMYSLGIRGEGPKPRLFSQVDEVSNMPMNSSVIGVFIVGVWFLYFYLANLAAYNWLGVFGFDSSELPIVTIYVFYIPIFINFMRKSTDLGKFKRFVIPSLALIGSVFMIGAAIYAHGIEPYLKAKENGVFVFPVLFYLIVFAVVMLAGYLLRNKSKADA